MKVTASLLTATALVAMMLSPIPAYADDPTPVDPPISDPPSPASPVDVPPLVSEPLVIPPSTTPEGDFTNCCNTYQPDPQASAPPVPAWTPPPPPWLSWTPAQLQALNNYVSKSGRSVSIEESTDGSLLIQDITGYTVDNSPNPWQLLDLNGSSTLLTPVSMDPSDSSGAPSANSLGQLPIPAGNDVSLAVTNTWTSVAMVLISWTTDQGKSSQWKALKPGEVWNTVFDAPAGSSTSSINLLSARGMSLRGFEIDYVKVAAAANPVN